MDFGLKGKTALVLGGGGGLGRAISKALAGEGANIAVADIDSGRPLQLDSMFRIASMTKAITSTAAMQLVEQNRFAIEDPVEKYLPEFKGQMVIAEEGKDHVLLKPPVHPITVKNVLSHTSGLPFGPRVERHIDQFPLAESVICDALTSLKFQPDSKYSYANAGINTAGRIVEVVSGISYEAFMQTRLFDPLGMKDTSFLVPREKRARRAAAYGFDEDGRLTKRVSWSGVVVSERPEDMAYESGGAGHFAFAFRD